MIVLLPVTSFLILLIFGKKLGAKSAYVAIAAVAIGFILSVRALVSVINNGEEEIIFSWLKIGNFDLSFGLFLDSLSAMMLVIVNLVSLLVQIFSVGYMHGDKRIGWFYACLSMFTASMLLLVYSPNYVQLYMAWEGVGLFSYLLIGYWFEKRSASDAAKKAFIVTRIGDLGFAIGLVLLYVNVGTLDMDKIFAMRFAPALASTISILIFFGAMGKSAQFPLHVWLPDAMEGPTPVSALIHAATMVAAGVFLVARSYPLFTQGPEAMQFIAIIGTITAFMAATIALVVTDIKKILAYSTISQLGYMMLGLGVGAYAAGIFHLMTHAFFKALLFLGAGSVIHSVQGQEIFKMGGLARKMKVTSVTFIIGGLALAGVPPLSGFWSKDEILTSAYASGNTAIFIVGLLTALLTAFYTFRLIFVVFFGEPQHHSAEHAHESPAVMSIPLIILGALAAVAGLIGSPLMNNAFQGFVAHGHEAEKLNLTVMGLSTAAALLGVFGAWLQYVRKIFPAIIASRENTQLYFLLLNKYYLDELYYVAIVLPTKLIANAVLAFDQKVVDGIVNGIAWLIVRIGKAFRRIQSGYVQNYAFYMIAGLIVLIIYSLRTF